MHEIKVFPFKKSVLPEVKSYQYGRNWPIVYILEGQKEAYIGESSSAYRRSKQHIEGGKRSGLDSMYLIADPEYNKSATLDIESMLIKYIAGDGKYQLQNSNHGLQDADYFDKERYRAKFEILWEELRKLRVANKKLSDVENSDIFKFSPYKTLTDDQLAVANEILDSVKNSLQQSYIVSGDPGTGKSIVGVFLMKAVISKVWGKTLKVGLVVPMTSLRKTLKNVFRKVKGLSPNMVMGPNEIVGKTFDLLVVDEAHRLQRRVNLTNFVPFDLANKAYNLGNGGTQLDWIMKAGKQVVLFYDPQQSVKPADIRPIELQKYEYAFLKLQSQMRVKAGDDYIRYVNDILSATTSTKRNFPDYEFKLFDTVADLIAAIKQKDREHGLSRLVAGYSWKWDTKKNKVIDYDFEIEGIRLKWNNTTLDWVNSPNAVNEVGCIHTIQGYDLNYAGVILGREIDYDPQTRKIVVDKTKYHDFNGKRGLTDLNELEIYIKNIYKTLLTRGIKGTYVYAVNENLRKYLREWIEA